MREVGELITRIAERTRRDFGREVLSRLQTAKPRKVLFNHLPRCGGTFQNRYLELHFPRRRTFAIDVRKPIEAIERFRALPEHVRHQYDLISGHLAHRILDQAHPDCLRVTVFREPVDRIISHYHYARRMPGHYLHSSILDADMSLSDYARSRLSGELCNWYTTHFSGLKLEDAERNQAESVDKAFHVIFQQYRVVGLLEDIARFAGELRVRANLRYFYRYGTASSSERPAIEEISVADRETIRNVNHLDVALYERIRERIEATQE